jgi:hypothetical protein
MQHSLHTGARRMVFPFFTGKTALPSVSLAQQKQNAILSPTTSKYKRTLYSAFNYFLPNQYLF